MSLLSAGSNLFSWHLLDVFGTSNNVLELLPLSVSVCIAWQHSRNLSRSTCLPGALLKEILLVATRNLKWWGGNSWIKAKWTIICQQYLLFLLTYFAPQRSHCHWETSWPSLPAAVSLSSFCPSVNNKRTCHFLIMSEPSQIFSQMPRQRLQLYSKSTTKGVRSAAKKRAQQGGSTKRFQQETESSLFKRRVQAHPSSQSCKGRVLKRPRYSHKQKTQN